MMMKNKTPFELNKFYEIHAQGFSEPIIGQIIDSKVTGEDILLVIKKSDEEPTVNLLMKAITAWSVISNKRIVPAA